MMRGQKEGSEGVRVHRRMARLADVYHLLNFGKRIGECVSGSSGSPLAKAVVIRECSVIVFASGRTHNR